MDETANPGYLLEALETSENEIQRAAQTRRVVRLRKDVVGKWKGPLVECRSLSHEPGASNKGAAQTGSGQFPRGVPTFQAFYGVTPGGGTLRRVNRRIGNPTYGGVGAAGREPRGYLIFLKVIHSFFSRGSSPEGIY